jgi:hypothetical protein
MRAMYPAILLLIVDFIIIIFSGFHWVK